MTLSIQFVAAIIVGGIASVRGSILGAAFVFALPRLLDQFPLLSPSSSSVALSSGDLNALIYGVLIIVFLLFEPGGVMGLIRRSSSLRRKQQREERDEPTEIAVLPASTTKTPGRVEDSALSQGEGV